MMPSKSPAGNNPRNAGGSDSDFPALAWMRRARAEDELLLEVARQVRRARRRRFATVSGLLVAVLVIGAIWNFGARSGADPKLASHTATISQPKRQILPDQSTVELDSWAQIEVDYSISVRRIFLQRGVAHFDVRKESRPFVVQANGVAVRAVGTAFSVQVAAQQVEVVVTEGQVKLSRLGAPANATKPTGAPEPQFTSATADAMDGAGSAPVVRAGHRAIISSTQTTPQVDAVSDADVATLQAWRIPVLEFSRSSLVEVVTLMNRHASGRQRMEFVIADPELRTVKLSGFLRTDNHDGLVRLLENQFGIRAEISGNTIALHKAR